MNTPITYNHLALILSASLLVWIGHFTYEEIYQKGYTAGIYTQAVKVYFDPCAVHSCPLTFTTGTTTIRDFDPYRVHPDGSVTISFEHEDDNHK